MENAWIPSSKRESLPIPNPMATTNLVYTTKGRQEILSKLDHIRLNEVSFDLPLTEVLNRLRTESQKRDPDGVGINFMVNPFPDASVGAIAPTDITGATTGAVTARPAAVDMTQITVKIAPATVEPSSGGRVGCHHQGGRSTDPIHYRGLRRGLFTQTD